MSRRILIVTAFALLCCRAGNLQAVVIYDENWEGGTHGQSILAPPFSYSSTTGTPNFLIRNTTPFAPSLAVDGLSNPGGNFAVATKSITGPSGAPNSVYTLTADLYGYSGLNDSYIGLNKSSLGSPTNDRGIYLGMGAGGGAGFWRFDARGVRPAPDNLFDFPVGQLIAKTVTATITLDINADTLKASLTDGVTTISHTFTGGNNYAGIDRLAIQQRFGGLTIDHVNIQETLIPEPGTFSAMIVGLVGCVGFRRMRRAYNAL